MVQQQTQVQRDKAAQIAVCKTETALKIIDQVEDAGTLELAHKMEERRNGRSAVKMALEKRLSELRARYPVGEERLIMAK
jgi:hypothetical protein